MNLDGPTECVPIDSVSIEKFFYIPALNTSSYDRNVFACDSLEMFSAETLFHRFDKCEKPYD